MLIEQRKEEILALLKNGEPLSKSLKDEILDSIEVNELSPLSGDDNYLCCNTGQSAPNRYQWITFDDCKRLYNGRAADNSACGH